MEVWLHTFALLGTVAELARRAEHWGFAGLLVADSQNLTADIWIELALAGAHTSRLRLGPGVTNPITRHLTVTASAAATLQAETGGRATLGFAQGDSALSQIGRRRLSVGDFERAVEALQGLLRGEQVRLGDTTTAIRWLTPANSESAKVPLHVAATGPRTIAAAARHADCVDLTVGAELERLRWAAATARAAGPSGLSVGAYVNVAVDPDRDAARELVRGSVATLARFGAASAPAVPLSDLTRAGLERLARGYEKDRHGQAASVYAQRLGDEFIDRFAVAASAAEVTRRLAEIGAAGIERLIVVPCSLDADRAAVARSNERFARDVLPALVA
jgi:5,10-methylenetetrahydromethanopterin reductase